MITHTSASEGGFCPEAVVGFCDRPSLRVTCSVTERRSLLRSSLVGAMWGVGHTFALLIAGVGVLLLRYQLTERMTRVFELWVGTGPHGRARYTVRVRRARARQATSSGDLAHDARPRGPRRRLPRRREPAACGSSLNAASPPCGCVAKWFFIRSASSWCP